MDSIFRNEFMLFSISWISSSVKSVNSSSLALLGHVPLFWTWKHLKQGFGFPGQLESVIWPGFQGNL
jgi:hypothetical protein